MLFRKKKNQLEIKANVTKNKFMRFNNNLIVSVDNISFVGRNENEVEIHYKQGFSKSTVITYSSVDEAIDVMQQLGVKLNYIEE